MKNKTANNIVLVILALLIIVPILIFGPDSFRDTFYVIYYEAENYSILHWLLFVVCLLCLYVIWLAYVWEEKDETRSSDSREE